jgi:hypothetical protein
MKLDGYYTSSTIVKKIFEAGEKFKVVQLITEDILGVDVHKWETRFLRENKIAQRDNWFNKHNNENNAFGSDEFLELLLLKYGVTHCTHIPGVLEKMKDTNVSRYGVPYIMQSEELKQRFSNSCLENLGVPWPMMSADVKAKSVETCLEKYGVTNGGASEIAKEKSKDTCLEKYGVEFTFQADFQKEKTKKTLVERYGVDNIFKSEATIKKLRADSLEKYGVEFCTQREDIKVKIRETNARLKARESVQEIYRLRDLGILPSMVGFFGRFARKSDIEVENLLHKMRILAGDLNVG